MLSLEVQAKGVCVGWVAARECRVAPSDAALLAEVERAKAAPSRPRRLPRAPTGNLPCGTCCATGPTSPRGVASRPASTCFGRRRRERSPSSTASWKSTTSFPWNGSSPFRWWTWAVPDARLSPCAGAVKGESYVFNTSGQVLELRDLLVVSKMPGDDPCASPIKDSQATKTHDGTRGVLGLLYAPLALRQVASEGAGGWPDCSPRIAARSRNGESCLEEGTGGDEDKRCDGRHSSQEKAP